MVPVNPMLASTVARLPVGVGWAYEFKWDGVRALLDVDEQGTSVHSRNGNEVTDAYPELITLSEGVGDALFDGEIVAFLDGRPSFAALQRRMHVRGAAQAERLAAAVPVTFVAFDLLRRFGVDLTARAYVERRATLERWAQSRPDWTLSPYFDDGAATEAAAREHGLEGVVAKRLASVYRPGVRGPDWQKLRFVRTGDFVVLGWEAAVARPTQLSSLVLGYFAGDRLQYAGKVGSGLAADASAVLAGRLDARGDCPLAVEPPPSPGRSTRWVEPTVVVEVEFAAWTDEGRLRHPVFHRIRTDKGPEQAVGDA
jgi:bifunctional non-homologous end joining protein LigD